jgi:hypothetical protein
MKTVNDFIKELQNLRDDVKDLPCQVEAPNGLMFDATVKFKTKDGLPLAMSEIESVVISS